MNDYFLRILIRQRHREILEEISAARLSCLNRPATNGRMEGMARILRSFLLKFKKPAGPVSASFEERQTT